jgi:GH24 family phage-related lysozyme (muramidase)
MLWLAGMTYLQGDNLMAENKQEIKEIEPEYPWYDPFGFGEPSNKATIDAQRPINAKLRVKQMQENQAKLLAPKIDRKQQLNDESVDIALPMISKREVFLADAYADPVTGTPTVGTGFTYWNPQKAVKLGEKITKEKNDEMLKERLRKDLKYLETFPNYEKMNPHMRAALLSFKFNTGEGGAPWTVKSNETLIKALNSPNFAKEVPVAISLYNKAQNPKTKKREIVPGLVNRRKEESERWNTKYVDPKQAEEEAKAKAKADADAAAKIKK